MEDELDNLLSKLANEVAWDMLVEDKIKAFAMLIGMDSGFDFFHARIHVDGMATRIIGLVHTFMRHPEFMQLLYRDSDWFKKLTGEEEYNRTLDMIVNYYPQ